MPIESSTFGSNDTIVKEVIEMSAQDEKVIRKIYAIIQRGNNVEIKGTKDGGIKVFEVKKKIAV